MPQKYLQINVWANGLHTERDRPSWFLKNCSHRIKVRPRSLHPCTAHLHLPFRQSQANSEYSVALAVVMLVFGYVSRIMAAIWSRSLLFYFESVALPALTTSVERLHSI